ncbi:hypothetical protein LIER_06109 [Lithospermum erythrorhizon]|uniref:RING-type domain-containing protein n=1 Tax=Lithospermum erythrorhizon TaxID=34254 RepID=A0AAV3P411_LITER
MASTSQQKKQENQTDRFPLLMERAEYRRSKEHVIDIEGSGAPSSSPPLDNDCRCLDGAHDAEGPSTSSVSPATRSTSSISNSSSSRSSSIMRRGDGPVRRHPWSLLNTTLCIAIELVFSLGLIIAAVVVLSVSRHENPEAPLFAWVVGYATGCVASLPLLYWRYLHRNQVSGRRSTRFRQGSAHVDSPTEPNSYMTISLTRSSDEVEGHNASTRTWDRQESGILNTSALVEHFKMALDCFFAVWFVVGNVWIFGGHTSSSDAPNLYRLCIVYLMFSCIGYAMPFILCAMICCCLPCIISVLGIREDMNGVRGASEESINALPAHKFKLKKTESSSNEEGGSEDTDDGGVVAEGTEKERAISGKDAACCICLTKYVDDDDLRELPCSHFFHTECVDKWLKINASCPLCKYEIGGGHDDSHSPSDPTPQV